MTPRDFVLARQLCDKLHREESTGLSSNAPPPPPPPPPPPRGAGDVDDAASAAAAAAAAPAAAPAPAESVAVEEGRTISLSSSILSGCTVCDRPYLPQLAIDPDDNESVKRGAAAVLLLLLLRLPGLGQRRDIVDADGSAAAVPESDVDDNELLTHVSSPWIVEPVGGGVTNKLFHIRNISAEGGGGGADSAGASAGAGASSNVSSSTISVPSSCLVRIFGAEGMIDRDVETSHFAQLASQNLAPSYYGRLQNARIEGWCDHMRPLEVEELNLPHIRRGIAEEMAKLHGLFRRDDNEEDGTGNNKGTSQEEEEEEVVLWTQLDEWCMSAVAGTARTESQSATATATATATSSKDPLPIDTIPGELQWIRSWIHDSDNGDGNRRLEVAFCHNDVLAANVLVDDASGRIQLIDFEYGGMNYVAFDIANHWNEYAGGPPHTACPNYTWFPSPQDQREFVAAYLTARKRIEHEKARSNGDNTLSSPRSPEEKPPPTIRSADDDIAGDIEEDEEVQRLLRDVRAFVLVNHLYWGLWAVNQARTEGCHEYDYATYAHKRFEQYVTLKRELVV